MFDSETFTTDMLSMPTRLAKVVLDTLQATDEGQPLTLNDPNNGFVIQLFSTVAIASKFSEKIDNLSNYLYPQRARNAEQLFPHLSEFDYTKLMASPASLPFVFALSRDWIVTNAVPYDDNYNKIQIPSTSYFTMSGITFSMYYPIDILVNKNTGAVSAFYNTQVTDPLYSLSSNMLLETGEFTQNNIRYFRMQFMMHQFARTISVDTISSLQGFNKPITYDDQFYAMKVFSGSETQGWTELKYSLSQMYYDYTTPTAILTIKPDVNQVRVVIPQIYFTNNQIGQKVKIELYTTKGAVHYSLSPSDVTSVTAQFNTKSSIYAAPLEQPPTSPLFPAVVEVVGGSDALQYAEIRDAVVNQRLYDRVAVTTPEILEAGKKAGFVLTRVVDDLTERMYYASNLLKDSKDFTIPTFAGNILIADESLNGDPSTILKHTDGYYTILPTTPFLIAPTGLTCTPMTDAQITSLSALSKPEYVAALNTGKYVRQPFHIALLTQPKSPEACIFNLLSPTVNALTFKAENAHSAPQMSVTSYEINHLNAGTGGYEILLGVTRSANIKDAAADQFAVFLTVQTKIGSFAYLPAVYTGVNANGDDIWRVALTTSYHITTDSYLTVNMQDSTDVLQAVNVALLQNFSIITSFVSGFDPSVLVDPTLNTLLPPTQINSYVVMSNQQMTIELGLNLSQQIYCGVNTTWGNDVYDTADNTLYYKTAIPIFQTAENQALNTRYNSQTHGIEVVQIYAANDTPADTHDIVVTTTNGTTVPVSGTTTTLSINDTTGLLVGMPVRGLNIPVNAVISGIQAHSITISKLITVNIPARTQLTITNGSVTKRTTAVQSAAGTTLQVPNTQGLYIGQSVFGFDVDTGSAIQSIPSATSIVLTKPTLKAVANNTLLTFINKTAHGVVRIAKGAILTDGAGLPIIVKDAQNQYLIPSILFDGRLFASDDPNDQQIVTTIAATLQNYANQISTLDAGLIEDSDVYYKPARTMGNATYNIGDNKTLMLPLELSFSVTVYIDPAIFENTIVLSTITASIYALINTAIKNPVISISDLSVLLKTSLGGNVTGIEMDDISGVDGLRLMALKDSDATPSVENIIVLQADGTLIRKPNIAIRYVPKPDTSEQTTLALS